MRYFTQELLDRFRSADDDIADAAHEEWEKNIEAYRAAVDAMALPPDVLSLARDYCFHDDRIASVNQSRHGRLFVSLRPIAAKGGRCEPVRIVTYHDASYATQEVLREGEYWLYDEVEALRYAPSPDARGESDWYFHRILTNKREVAVRFKSVTVTTA